MISPGPRRPHCWLLPTPDTSVHHSSFMRNLGNPKTCILHALSGWWLTYPSEKYEFVSWDDYSQYMESHKSHVPNHQPDILGCVDPSGTSLALRCGISTRDTVAMEDFSWTPTLATCGWPWKSCSQQMIVSHSVSICSYDIPITLFSHHIFPSYPCDP